MNPKISDFGMARILGQNESIANTRRVVGTLERYMSPEYAMKDIFSKKSDVYSFGAWELWKQGDSVELRDNSMASCPKEEVSKFIHVGLLCVQEHAADRPTISEVISMLASDYHVFA
ncbi:G-type lectin S-receptor-like serine/threonine-protein kinase B120 [Prunus yedoensis var. nudiflora]|uniref:G-type lectin S-receptor-like serine/threonine-protein kinase B120 n=1 Tax=Prunus yedoensis var. nudiflora TaxID=2094558 RepID=A0A314YMK7_PRUYE|nr:G-type lectin S-receptor-like serine/threonine-protein kinase B120 [Prunus yedoensis var. nudiflora]